MLTEFLDPGRVAARCKRAIEDRIGRLDPLLGLEQLEEIHCAQFDDLVAFAHDEAPGYRGFLTQRNCLVVVQKPGRFFDDLNRSAHT